MKVLNIYDFVAERIKVQPVTNAELDKVQKEFEDTLVKPGDELRHNDFVLVAHKDFATGNVEMTYTFYDKFCKCLLRADGKGLKYELLKDTFEYTYKNVFADYHVSTDYIVKIFRQDDVYDDSIVLSKDYRHIDELLENSRHWKCVYRNTKLLKKFHI